jgi:hypothetical protein
MRPIRRTWVRAGPRVNRGPTVVRNQSFGRKEASKSGRSPPTVHTSDIAYADGNSNASQHVEQFDSFLNC